MKNTDKITLTVRQLKKLVSEAKYFSTGSSFQDGHRLKDSATGIQFLSHIRSTIEHGNNQLEKYSNELLDNDYLTDEIIDRLEMMDEKDFEKEERKLSNAYNNLLNAIVYFIHFLKTGNNI